MRQIGTIPQESDARRFADYILTLGITSRIDAAPAGWDVWVHHEDRVPRAKEELGRFLADPADPKYKDAVDAARAIRKDLERKEREHARNSIPLRDRWSYRPLRRTPVTATLIGLSIGVAVLSLTPVPAQQQTGLGTVREALSFATIHPIDARAPADRPADPWTRENGQFRSNAVDDLRRGEIWRPITPIFLHFSPLHLLFKMMWLYSLGGLIEIRRGSAYLAVFVLVAAVLSNTTQYLVSHSPLFGGMSGVDFALMGYVWMKGLYEPDSGMGLGRQTVTYMLLYLVLCNTGVLGPIANAAHLSGLVFGILAGIAPHLISTRHGG